MAVESCQLGRKIREIPRRPRFAVDLIWDDFESILTWKLRKFWKSINRLRQLLIFQRFIFFDRRWFNRKHWSISQIKNFNRLILRHLKRSRFSRVSSRSKFWVFNYIRRDSNFSSQNYFNLSIIDNFLSLISSERKVQNSTFQRFKTIKTLKIFHDDQDFQDVSEF